MSYYNTCPQCGANLDPSEVCDCRYTVNILSPVGLAPYIGDTMTDEQEREFAHAAALRNMHKLGLEPCEGNIPEYYRRVKEALV